jgi:hypothetical protein
MTNFVDININMKIITLCGSSKFKKEFDMINKEETMNGNIVISLGIFGHYENIDFTIEEKEMLDRIHKKKIDLADEIFVINVNNYIGKSTKSEIEYAKRKNKKIRYLVSIP